MPLFVSEPIVLSPIALLGGIGMLVVALGFFGYALARRLGGWMLLWGALAWVVTVALKFAWAIPVNRIVYEAAQGLPQPLGNLLFYVYVGALTGVFEVGLTWLLLRYTRLGKSAWGGALAFGIGFGAVEAALLALSPLITVIMALVNPSSLPAGVLEQFAVLNNPLQGLAPIWERFFTIWVHILSAVLLFYGIRVRQARWFWLAFLYKTGIDAVAAFAQVSGFISATGTEGLTRIWTIEALVGLWGVVGWLGARWVGQHFPTSDAALPTPPAAPTPPVAPRPGGLSPQV